MGAVEQAEPGDLMSRVTADTTLLREVTTDSLVGAVTGLIALTGTVVLMALLDPVLLAVKLVPCCWPAWSSGSSCRASIERLGGRRSRSA
jgi:ABC-type multidrug transport system fused ATPase/permease subunit